MANSSIVWIDTVFNWCVRLLYDVAAVMGITYEEINVWLFVIVLPLGFIISISLNIYFMACLRRTATRTDTHADLCQLSHLKQFSPFNCRTGVQKCWPGIFFSSATIYTSKYLIIIFKKIFDQIDPHFIPNKAKFCSFLMCDWYGVTWTVCYAPPPSL